MNIIRRSIKISTKKVFLIITEFLTGSAATISLSALAILHLSGGFIISSSAALLTSIAILITTECIWKLKIR